jgi:hypothetical protein
MIAKSFSSMRKGDLKLSSRHHPVVGGLSDEFGLVTDVEYWQFWEWRDPGYALRTGAYRPNSRSISQPSSPRAASGRTEVRVGAGLPAVLAGEGAFTGVLACEAACMKLEKKPPACKPGNAATGTP